MDRRKFLKAAAVTTGAAIITGRPDAAFASHGPHDSPGSQGESNLADPAKAIRKYSPIGKTGLKMSDISFGCGKLPSPSLPERAFDMGINYFDTAPDYGFSETLLGKFIKNRRSDRSKMIITTKICEADPYPGHLSAGETPEKIISVVEASLARLQTDYVDFIMVHAIAENKNDTVRLKDDNLYTALDRLKKQGKVRFTGFTSHGDHDTNRTIPYAIDTGQFDMMMVAFNFEKVPGAEEHVRHAYSKGMGVLNMKTFAGAKHRGVAKFKQDGASFEQAALRWSTSHPEISGTVITITNVNQLRHYVAVSGSQLTAADAELLDRYAKTYAKTDCRIGCAACRDACPDGVNVPAVLRFNMYYENYTDHKEIAISRYAGLKKSAGSCGGCSSVACAASCPYGLPVRDLLVRAHENLSIA